MNDNSFMENTSIKYVSVLDLLVILAEYRKTILRVVGVTAICSILLFFVILSRWYKSVATVLPPKDKSSLSLLTSLTKAAAPLRSLGLGTQSDEISQYLTILNSRTVAESVIAKFNLQEVYNLSDIDKTIKELQGNVEIGLGKEDVSVEIAVFDTDPQRSAAMANYYVEQLNAVYQRLSAAEAQANREFIERRYRQNVADVTAAEEKMKAFQKKYHVYSIPDQLKGAVDAAAAIQSQIVLKEVQLGLLEKTTTPENPLQQSVRMELEQLRRELNTMNTGGRADTSGFAIFAPFSRAPDIGMEYLRTFREVELQNKIMELLLPLLEEAKIQEQKDTPAVLVLDKAVPPVRHQKPKRLTFTLLACVASFLLTVFACAFHRSQRINSADRSDEDKAKIALVKSAFSAKNFFRL